MTTKVILIVICAYLFWYVANVIGSPKNDFDAIAGLSICLIGLAAIVIGLCRSIYKELFA